MKNSLLELVAVNPDRDDQPSQVVARNASCYPFLDLWGWDVGVDNAHRQRNVVDPMHYYPLEALNQRELVHLSDVTGKEGTDWQNPYAWAARGILQYETPMSSGLRASYGVDRGETPGDVALNVRATSGVLQVGPLTGGYGMGA